MTAAITSSGAFSTECVICPLAASSAAFHSAHARPRPCRFVYGHQRAERRPALALEEHPGEHQIA
jgi:hypothetical protein